VWPSLLLGVFALLGAAGAWQTAALAGRRRTLARRLRRAALQQAEAQRVLKARRQLADTAATAAAVVNAGNLTVQTAHQLIAAIPFGILEAIPATRDTTRIVRATHDAIAGLVYGAIGAASRQAAKGLRQC
jgi:hypothetical protein